MKITIIYDNDAWNTFIPDVPVILCTGFSENINEQKNVNQGVEGFMMKPVTRTELAETVRKILDESENN